MKRIVLGLLAASLVAFSATAHHDGERVEANKITVSHVWTYENAEMAHANRVYMTIENGGEEADRLVGASVTFADAVVFEGQAVDENGVLAVRELSAIAIEPGQSITLQPGAMWLELESVKQTYKHGEHFHLTLSFEKAGDIEVDVEVEAVDDHDHEDGDDHDHDHEHRPAS